MALTLSQRMARIRKTDTKPEMLVRRMLHALGYRYRLHRRDLPGNPDIVFASRKKLIFVHGCFWHQHDCPLGAKQPRARPEYWLPKLKRNKERDARNLEALEAAGWKALIIWECELGDVKAVEHDLRTFLGSSACRSASPSY
jgi:DNA mismatch endonuclease, patch repair protein